MNEVKAVLADRPSLGRIHLCECNSIHMTVGPVTVNLAPETFAQMATMVHKAMEQLARIFDLADKDLTDNGLNDKEGNRLLSIESNRSRFTH